MRTTIAAARWRVVDETRIVARCNASLSTSNAESKIPDVGSVIAKFRKHVSLLKGGSKRAPHTRKIIARLTDKVLDVKFLESLSSRQLALATWSLVRVSATHGQDDAVATVIATRSSEFDSHEIAMVMWACASCQVSHRPMAAALASGPLNREISSGGLANASSRSLANLAWSTCTLSIECDELLRAVQQRMLRSTEDFDTQGIANVAWALVSAGDVSMLAAVRTKVASAALARSQEFGPRELTSMIWALAALPATKAEGQISDASSCKNMAATASNTDQHVEEAIEKLAAVSLNFSDETRRGSRNSDYIHVLSTSVWALAQVATSCSPLLSQLTSRFLEQVSTSQAIGHPRNVVCTLWALAAIRSDDIESFCAIAAKTAVKSVAFSGSDLASVSWAMAAMSKNARPSLICLTNVTQQLCANSQLNLIHLGRICWAWANLAPSLGILESTLLPEANRQLKELSPGDCTNLDAESCTELLPYQRSAGENRLRTHSNNKLDELSTALLQLTWSASFGPKKPPEGMLDALEKFLRLLGRQNDAKVRAESESVPRRIARLSPITAQSLPSTSVNVGDLELEISNYFPSFVFRNFGIAVLHKPPHWEVDDAVAHGVRSRGQPLSEYIRSEFPHATIVSDRRAQCGFQGRLDVQSSGLVACALTYEAHFALQFQQDSLKVVREYAVLVHGHVPDDVQEIRAPILARPGHPSCADYSRGMPAITLLKTIARLERVLPCPTGSGVQVQPLSLALVSITTGRKHQIRCHLSHIGHPVVTDAVYSPRLFDNDVNWCPRTFLHRFRLAFPELPASFGTVDCAVPLPSDLRAVLSDKDSVRSGRRQDQHPGSHALGLIRAIRGCSDSSDALTAWSSSNLFQLR